MSAQESAAPATPVTVVDRAGPEAPIVKAPMAPWRVVAVRAGRTWLQAFLGFVGVLVGGSLVVDATNWARWLEPAYLQDIGTRFLVCVIVATAVAGVSAAQNALELLGKWDITHPERRA